MTTVPDLNQQVKLLIEQAPNYGVSSQSMAAIAPVFQQLATQLKHQQYYIPQSMDHQWVVTTLSNRQQPDRTQQVIYAFADLNDVTVSTWTPENQQLVALAVPVIDILFQMMAFKAIDSVVFLDTPGDVQMGTEILSSEVQALVRQHILQLRSRSMPPDIA